MDLKVEQDTGTKIYYFELSFTFDLFLLCDWNFAMHLLGDGLSFDYLLLFSCPLKEFSNELMFLVLCWIIPSEIRACYTFLHYLAARWMRMFLLQHFFFSFGLSLFLQ